MQVTVDEGGLHMGVAIYPLTPFNLALTSLSYVLHVDVIDDCRCKRQFCDARTPDAPRGVLKNFIQSEIRSLIGALLRQPQLALRTLITGYNR